METNNKIISRILSDATAHADQIIGNANERATIAISDNVERQNSIKDETNKKCALNSKEIVKNALSNAELDVRKYRLKEKQSVISDAYKVAYEKLLNLPEKEYLALIEKLVRNNADQGERVLIAGKDSKIITQAFLDKFELDLTLAGTTNIDGGVILEGNGYDKNLSLDVLIDALKDQTEMQVAKILFDGE